MDAWEPVARRFGPKQLDWMVNSGARLNIAEGAIRAGKTVPSLFRWLSYIAKDAPRGGELIMTGRTQDTVFRNLILPMQDPDLFGPLARQVKYTAGASSGTIFGRRVHILGANDVQAEMKVRGMTCAGALIDEATILPEKYFSQVLGRMSVDGAQAFATTNADGPGHWLRQNYLLRQNVPGMNLRQWHFGLDDNPSLSESYKASIRAEFTGLWFRRMVNGEWVQAQGSIYSMWDPDRHVVDIIPPVKQWLGAGIDYGTNHPFVALLLGLGVDNVLYLVAEYRFDSKLAHRQLTDVEYSAAVREWITQVRIPATQIRGPVPRYWVVDPSAASFRQQLVRDGITSVKANNEVQDGIRTVSSLLAMGRLKVHRSCEGFIAEVSGYCWDDRAAQLGEDKPVKANDDSVDAARYIVKTTQSIWQQYIPMLASSADTLDGAALAGASP